MKSHKNSKSHTKKFQGTLFEMLSVKSEHTQTTVETDCDESTISTEQTNISENKKGSLLRILLDTKENYQPHNFAFNSPPPSSAATNAHKANSRKGTKAKCKKPLFEKSPEHVNSNIVVLNQYKTAWRETTNSIIRDAFISPTTTKRTKKKALIQKSTAEPSNFVPVAPKFGIPVATPLQRYPIKSLTSCTKENSNICHSTNSDSGDSSFKQILINPTVKQLPLTGTTARTSPVRVMLNALLLAILVMYVIWIGILGSQSALTIELRPLDTVSRRLPLPVPISNSACTNTPPTAMVPSNHESLTTVTVDSISQKMNFITHDSNAATSSGVQFVLGELNKNNVEKSYFPAYSLDDYTNEDIPSISHSSSQYLISPGWSTHRFNLNRFAAIRLHAKQ